MFRKLKLIIIVSLIAAFIGSPVSMAQSSTSGSDQRCVDKYREYLSAEGKNFMEQIQAHFNNPSSTTTLIPDALAKFNAYKKMIEAKKFLLQSEIINDEKDTSQGQLISQFQKCDQAMDDHLFILKQVMRDHIKRNTTSKRTFIYLQEYKRINGKMSELNKAVGQMQGYFKVFETKLQNFIPKCLKG